jgi:hypothetical protein
MRAFPRYWSRALASVLWGQWLMVRTGFQAAQTVLKSASTNSPGASVPPRAALGPGKGESQDLIDRAAARTSKGLAPPREIYQAPVRNQVDWSKFPDWARPSDPELFEGSAHEG